MSAAIRNERIGLQAGALALLATALWGGNSVSIKIGLQGMPPVAVAGARFLLGALTVLVGALFFGVSVRLPAARWRSLVGLCLLFSVQIVLLNVGTRFTNASRSTVLICTYPFFTALFAHFLIPGDRLSLTRICGLVLSFLGVAAIFAESIGLAQTQYLFGDFLVLISGLLLGLRQVVTKRLVAGLHPFQVLFWQALLSLPLFAVVSYLFEGGETWAVTPPVAGALLYQGVVVAGFCFILMVSLLRRHSASRLGAFGFVTPACGVLLSALLLDEALSPILLVSLALIGVGIVVVNREKGET